MVGGSVPGPAEVSRRPRGGFKATGVQSSLECHGRRDMRVVRRRPHHEAHRRAHAREGKGIRGRQRFLSKAFRLTHTGFLMQLAWKAAAANDCLTLAENYKLELRKRRSTLGSKLTPAEILVPEKCRGWRGGSISQGPLAASGSRPQLGEPRSCGDQLLWSGAKAVSSSVTGAHWWIQCCSHYGGVTCQPVTQSCHFI